MPDPSTFTQTFRIMADHPDFIGHFPEFPVFPAVSQIEMVVKALSGHLGRPIEIAEVSRAKFKQILAPNTTITLTITADAGEGNWTLANGQDLYSKGQFRYEFA